jgi:hypothetical protein
VRELLNDRRFRYFASEYFQNAGPVRQAFRDYWLRAALPPDFERAEMPLRFQPVLDDLRANPRYLLAIGSRVHEPQEVRDHRIARHFFEEVADRGIHHHTPGVLLLGLAHAAATPFVVDMKMTTRMILEQHGFRCTSILVMTDFVEGEFVSDSVFPMSSDSPMIARLGSLTRRSPICFSTRLVHSPFFQVRHQYSNTGKSIAEQYEFVMFERI